MKFLKRKYEPHRNSSGYLAYNNPDLAARYIFKDGEVIDEVTGLSFERTDAGVRLPLPDLNTQTVRVAYKYKDKANAPVSNAELCRIGGSEEEDLSAAFVTTVFSSQGARRFSFSVRNKNSQQSTSGTYVLTDDGLYIFEFDKARTALSYNFLGPVGTSSGNSYFTGAAGENSKYTFNSSEIGAQYRPSTDIQDDHFLSTEFSHPNFEILFIEVRNKRAGYLIAGSQENAHSRPYYGTVTTNPNERKSLKCNGLVVDGQFIDTLSSNIITTSGVVERGLLDVGAEGVTIAPGLNERSWSIRFFASDKSEGTLFTVRRGEHVQDITLTDRRLSAGSEGIELRRNAIHKVWLVGVYDTVYCYVNDTLAFSFDLPLTHPVEPVEVKLHSTLKVTGIQAFDANILNTEQFYNNAVTSLELDYAIQSAFSHTEGEADFGAGKITNLNGSSLQHAFGRAGSPRLHFPSIKPAPVIGLSAIFRAHGPTNNLVSTRTLSFTVNGVASSLQLIFQGSQAVRLLLTCGETSPEVRFGPETQTNGASLDQAGFKFSNLHLHVAEGCVIASLYGRNIVVNIEERATYCMENIQLDYASSNQSGASSILFALTNVVTYSGGASLARRIPNVRAHGGLRSRFDGEPVLAFGADGYEFVSCTTFNNGKNQENHAARALTGDFTLPVRPQQLSAFTLHFCLRLLGSTSAVSFNLGGIQVEASESQVSFSVGESVLEYEANAFLHKYVLTYDSAELKLSVDHAEVDSVAFTGEVELVDNLTATSTNVLLSDFRLYSEVKDLETGLEVAFRKEEPDLPLHVEVTATAVQVLDNNAEGSITTVQDVEVFTLIREPALEMLGSETTVQDVEVFTLTKEPSPVMLGSETTVQVVEVYVLTQEV